METFVFIFGIVTLCYIIGQIILNCKVCDQISGLMYTREKQAESIEALRMDISIVRNNTHKDLEKIYNDLYQYRGTSWEGPKFAPMQRLLDLEQSLESFTATLGYQEVHERAKSYYKKVEKEKKS